MGRKTHLRLVSAQSRLGHRLLTRLTGCFETDWTPSPVSSRPQGRLRDRQLGPEANQGPDSSSPRSLSPAKL